MTWLLPAAAGNYSSKFDVVTICGRGEDWLLAMIEGKKKIDPGGDGLVLLESKNVLA